MDGHRLGPGGPPGICAPECAHDKLAAILFQEPQKVRIRNLLPAALALAIAAPSYAARPMITDDARIVDAKACQVETWARRNVDSTEFWALPACNPFGNAELTFGGALTNENGETHLTDNQAQVKTLFRPYDAENRWGVGLAVGTVRRPHRETYNTWPGDYYFYVPVSMAVGSDDLVLHVNGGAARHRDEGRTIGTWGIGAEARINERLYFIPETFSNDRGRPFYQLGLRFWVVPSRMQVDATFGNRLVSETRERWFSIGMRLLSPPWFP